MKFIMNGKTVETPYVHVSYYGLLDIERRSRGEIYTCHRSAVIRHRVDEPDAVEMTMSPIDWLELTENTIVNVELESA
jgi:hypothetical protein